MGVKISRGRTAADAVTRLQVVPLTTSTGPTHDDAEEKKGELTSSLQQVPSSPSTVCSTGQARAGGSHS